jgi:two-component system, sensor histidine kinase and response regulator
MRTVVRLKQQYDDLAAMMELREKMARAIIHDMRNPLTLILGNSELMLMDKNSGAGNRGMLQIINNQAKRLNAFINDMLMMSKLSHGKMILKREPVDLVQLLQQAVQNQQMMADAKRIKLTAELAATGTPPPSLDANLIQRAVENLLSNAIKYSLSETTVTLQYDLLPAPSAAAGLARNRIRVLDQGDGIPEEFRARIFSEFATVELKEKGVMQMGVGLHFCKLVADAHGGRIYVEPNQPNGSIFVLEI